MKKKPNIWVQFCKRDVKFLPSKPETKDRIQNWQNDLYNNRTRFSQFVQSPHLSLQMKNQVSCYVNEIVF